MKKFLSALVLGVCGSVAADVVEPLRWATRWFDASSPSYYETDAQGNVTKIRDRSGLGGDATPLNAGVCATVGTTNGVPAFLFGASGSGVDYAFAETNDCHTLFCVIDIEQHANAWLGGSSWCVDLQRGANGEYGARNLARPLTGVYNAGLRVADPGNTLLPTGKQLISVMMRPGDAAFSSSRFAQSGSNRATSGGRALSEYIVFAGHLGVAHRTQVEKYLVDKWGIRTPPVTLSGEIFANEMYGEVYNGDLTLAAGTTLCINSLSSHSGVAVFGCRGRLALTDPKLVVTGTVSVANFASGRSFPIISWGEGSDLTLASFDLTDFRCVNPPMHQSVEFVVEGNALCAKLVVGEDWTLHDLAQGSLVAEDGGKYLVINASTSHTITVAAHATATLILDDVTISGLTNATPFSIGAGATARVELLNKSTLRAPARRPAIALDPDGAALEFCGTGNGSLYVYAGASHAGIYVPTGASFTMNATNALVQVDGSAKQGPVGGAAVGGAGVVGSGTLTFNAGTFRANGKQESAAIGVGLVNDKDPPDVGPITINGGFVQAYASAWANGIGGAVAYNTRGADMESFTMNGGTLVAEGVQAAAIGGGTGGRMAATHRGGILRRFRMTGGTITARTRINSTDLPENFALAAIGGGPSRHKDCAQGGGAQLIEIAGGTVNASGGAFGLGAGGNVDATTSYAAGVCTVVVSGGVVNAHGTRCGIGGVAGTEAQQKIVVTGGAVYAPNGCLVRPTNGAANGDVALNDVPMHPGAMTTFEVPGTPGYTYAVPSDANSDGACHLWLPPGQGTYGDIDWIIDSRDEAVDYTLDARRLFISGVCSNVTVTGASTNSIAVQNQSDVALTLNGLEVVSGTHGALTLEAHARVALNLVGANRLEGTAGPGVRIAESATLRIDGTGSLDAKGGYKNGGIGNGAEYNSGTVIVDGGTVTAVGGEQAAGIGCGCRDGRGAGTCGPVVVNGGTVTARGGGWAAGIGGGTAYNSDGGRLVSFTMNGGTATVTGQNAAGLGGGAGGAGYDKGKNTWDGGTVGAITLNGGVLKVSTSVNDSAPGLLVPAIGGGGVRNPKVTVSAGGGDITVNGGVLMASGGHYGLGAGGTTNGTATCKDGLRTRVRINDGTVEVAGSRAAIGGPEMAEAATTNVAAVVIRGGSVKFSGALQVAPTAGDDDGSRVYRVPVRKTLLRTPSPYACALPVTTVAPPYTFSYHGAGHAGDENVHFWLPNGRHRRGDGFFISVNGEADAFAGYTGVVFYLR